jgi:signal transduction histidine kinase
MSLKFRFALLFSLSVFLILAISAVSIYVLNEGFRKEEFFKRLKVEAEESSAIYFEHNTSRVENERELLINAHNSLPVEKLAILDSSQQVLYFTPDNYQINIPGSTYKLARQKGSHLFSDDDREAVVTYKTSPAPHYVVVSAYDTFGRNKVTNLRIILIFSVIGGLILSALLAFFSVKQIMKPLSHLKQQMQRINEQNLTERLVVDKANTELMQIANNFNDMLDRLEDAFETRKSFVQHASHELRTPLANMLSQTEVALHHELTTSEYRDILQSLKEDQQEMISLTNSLLLLSQYENLTYLDTWKRLRIDELVYETIDITKTVFRKTAISVDFETMPEDEETLIFKGNEMLVKSAIQNLIRNACNYSDDDRVNIIINPQNSGITIFFENSGKQLSKEEQEKLFIPFFRGENSTNKKGFGLGLSIVQRILSLHKAKVSYVAVGSNINRFIVYFPRNVQL